MANDRLHPRNRWLRQAGLWALLALLAVTLGGCGGSSGGGGTPTPTPTPTPAPISQTTFNLSGVVTAASLDVQTSPATKGTPAARTFAPRNASLNLAGVSVDIQGVPGTETVTDGNGFWEIPVAQEALLALYPDGNIVVNFRKIGYIDFHQVVNIKGDKPSSFTITLPKTTNVSVTTSGDAPLNASGDRLEGLPASVDHVLAYVGDPVDPDSQRVFPGAFRAVDSDDSQAELVSQAFGEFKALDANGNPVSLDRPVKVTLRLPVEYQNGTLKNENGQPYRAGDRIDWWYYDKTDQRWIVEDASPDNPGVDKAWVVSQDNALFVQAWVTHFSWWNADYPQTRAQIRVKVVDKNGNPLKGYPVFARGITYANLSSPATTDDKGVAVVKVKKSEVTTHGAAGSERVEIFVKVGDQEILYTPTSPDTKEGVTSGDHFEIYTPRFSEIEDPLSLDLTGDQNAKDKGGADLGFKGTPIRIAFDGKITGKVTDNNGKALANLPVYSNFGSVLTDKDGNYLVDNIYVATAGTQARVFVMGAAAQTAVLTQANPTVTLNFSVPVANLPPVIDRVNQNPGGSVLPGGQMTLQVEARDPEGGALTYTWALADPSQGTLTPDASDTSKALWTAPNTDSGTGFILITVTDAGGKTAKLTVPVSWARTPQPLRLTCRNDEGKPMPGVLVILHGRDGKSVERTLSTDASGVADFGTVTRGRVTLSLAWEERSESSYTMGSVSWKKVIYRTVNDARCIFTVVNVIPNTYTINLDQGSSITQPVSPDRKINLTATGTFQNGDYLNAQPGWGYFDLWNIPGSITAVSADWAILDKDHRQNDGKFSFLVTQGKQATHGQGITTYGFVLDQNANSGDRVSVAVNRIPASLDWASNRNTFAVGLSGARKGADYTLAGNEFFQEPVAPQRRTTGSTSGRFPFPGSFPVDTYFISAQGQQTSPDQTGLSVWQKATTLGTQLSIQYADYSFRGVSFDLPASGDRRILWTLAGQDAKDVINVHIGGYAWSQDIQSPDVVSTNTTFSWEIAFDPSTPSPYVLPDLPPALQGWVAIAQPANSSINVQDFDTIAGFDALVALYTSGQDPKDLCNTLRSGGWGSRQIPYQGETGTPQRQERPLPSNPMDRVLPSLRIFLNR